MKSDSNSKQGALKITDRQEASMPSALTDFLQARWKVVVFFLWVFALLARHYVNMFPPRLFAEDGMIFTKAAYEHGFSSFLEPYASYYHLLSRIIAYVAVHVLPINHLPTTFLLATLFILLFVVYAFLSAEKLHPVVRIAVIFALIFPPGGGRDDNLCLMSSHWFTSALYPLLLISPELRDWKRMISLCILVALVAMNDPLIIPAIPFFAMRAWVYRRNGMEKFFFTVATIACILQFHCVLVSPPPHWLNPQPCPREELLKMWVFAGIAQPIGMFVFGDRIAKASLHSFGVMSLCLLTLTAFFALAVYAFVKASPLGKKNALVFLLLGAAFYAASCYRNITSPQEIVANGYSRYFYVPFVFGVAALFSCLADLPNGFFKIVVLIVGSGIFVSTICLGRVEPIRLATDWEKHIQELNEKGSTKIPVTPEESWTFSLVEGTGTASRQH